MSAPAANDFSPAPRSTTQRNSSSADSSRIAAPSASHIGRPSAFNLAGLLSVTVATCPLRETRTGCMFGGSVNAQPRGLHYFRIFGDVGLDQRREFFG